MAPLVALGLCVDRGRWPGDLSPLVGSGELSGLTLELGPHPSLDTAFTYIVLA